MKPTNIFKLQQIFWQKATFTMDHAVYLCSISIAKLYLLLFPVSLKVRYHLRCESLCDEKPFTTILPDQRQILDDARESQCTLHILYFDDFSFFFLHLILNIHMKIFDFLSKKPKVTANLIFWRFRFVSFLTFPACF